MNYYNLKQGRIETLVFGLPPFRLFLEVMGMSVECEVVATFPKVVGKSAGEESLSWKIEPDMGT